MKKLLALALLGALALFAACSQSGTETAAPAPAANPAAAPKAETAGDKDIPAAVKAAFPGAQSFTKQHKDISPAQKADIEKDTGGKLPDNDHHSYLAFATDGGARKQIGAATVLSIGNDIQAVVIYENREGSPFIKEVRAEGVAPAFLDQFKGKGHDDKLNFGGAIKAQGADEAIARALALAIAVDVHTMQALYGAAHTH